MLVPTIMFTAVATLSFIALTRVSLHFFLFFLPLQICSSFGAPRVGDVLLFYRYYYIIYTSAPCAAKTPEQDDPLWQSMKIN